MRPLFFKNLFSSDIYYSKIKNVDALLKFAESIGELKYYKKCFIDKYLVINSKKNFKAVVGAGHFVATYKTEIFNYNFIRKSDYLLGGNSEVMIDDIGSNLGLWRLTTLNNFTYHMGNTMQQWYHEHLLELSNQPKYVVNINQTKIKKISKTKAVYIKLINKFFERQNIRGIILNKVIISKQIKDI